jgi:hypothetical protein
VAVGAIYNDGNGESAIVRVMCAPTLLAAFNLGFMHPTICFATSMNRKEFKEVHTFVFADIQIKRLHSI